MKKIVALFLTLVLVFSVAGCSAGNSDVGETPAAEQPTNTAGESNEQSHLIAVSLPTMDNPLMQGIADSMKQYFPDDDVQVSSANNDPNTQTAQVQNYITMGADMLVVMPCDSSSMTPVLKEAVKAGIKVFVTGTKLEDPDAYTCMATVNQYLVGNYCALLAKQWVDKNYPDAPDGSIEAAILTTSLNQDGVDKSNGLLQIAEPYMKNAKGEYIDENNNVVDEANKVPNPVYCPKLKIVQKVDAEMMQDARTAMQNILTTNPDVKVVLCVTSDGASGVNQVYMDSKMSAEELAKVGVFGCGVIGPEEDMLIESANGNGVFRGADQFGSVDLGAQMAQLAKEVLNDGNYEKDVWDPITLLFVKDGEIVKIPVDNTGVVKAVECY